MRLRSFSFLASTMLSGWLAAACGSEAPPEVLPEIDACVAGWRTVFSPVQTTFPRVEGLVLHGDRLYFGDTSSGLDSMGLSSVTTAGAELSSLRPDVRPAALWLEGDRVLYAAIGYVDAVRRIELHGVATAGGPHEAIVQVPLDQTLDRNATAFGLDREALYWARLAGFSDTRETSLWRAGRDGSPATMIAPLMTESGTLDGVTALDRQLVVLGDHVLLVVDTLFADAPWLVPKAGGTPKPLPGFGPNSKVIGATLDGTLLWSRIENPTARVDDGVFTVARSDVRGQAPTPFWTSKPRNAWPKAAWPEKDGAWLVIVSERASDGGYHLTAWSVDREGQGARLVCDPQVGRHVSAGTVTPAGRYLAVNYPLGSSRTSGYWELVALPQPAP